MRKRTLAFRPAKRRLPIFANSAAGILSGFRSLAEIAQHRIDRPLQFDIALPDCSLHSLPFSVGAQPLELLMRIKNKCRPGKSTRGARAVGVHPDDIQRLAAEAKGEMRIGRIGGDVWVPIELRGVLPVKKTQLFPKQIFEFYFVGLPGTLEDRDESRVFTGDPLNRVASEIVESGGQRVRRFRVTKFVENSQRLRIRIEGGLRAQAWKFRARNEFAECLLSFRGELIFPHHVFTRNTRLAVSLVAPGERRLLFPLVEISYRPRG